MALDLQPVKSTALDLQPVAPSLDLRPATPAPAKLDLQPHTPEPAAPADSGKSYFGQVLDAFGHAVERPMAMMAAPFMGEDSKNYLRETGALPQKQTTLAGSVNEGPIGAAVGGIYALPSAILSPLINKGVDYAVKNDVVSPSQVNNGMAALNILGVGGNPFRGVKVPPVVETAGNAIHDASDATPKPLNLPDSVDVPQPVGIVPEPVPSPMQSIKDAATSVRDVLSPTSAGKGAKAAEMAVSEYEGTGLRNRVQAENALETFAKQGQSLVDNPAEMVKFYDYVQGRSKGVQMADPALQPFADQLRDVATGVEAKLRELPQTEGMNYLSDYFPQAWKDEGAAKTFSENWVGKQGNTGFTQARKYPTIADGLAAGLELKNPNPAHAMMNYVNNAERAIAASKVFNDGRASGDIKFGAPGGKIPEGWAELKGRLATKPARTVVDAEGNQTFIPARQAYAPADYARVYNNYLSTGLERSAGAGMYNTVRELKNAQTMAQLSLSTHHFATIMVQTMASDLSRALKSAAVGDLKGAAGAMKDLVGSPLPGIGRQYRKGAALREQYEGLKELGPDMEARVQRFASAGGRLGEDPIYKGSTQKDLLTSYKDGTLGAELKANLTDAVKTPLGAPVQAVKVAGRLADTVAAPLFNRYIPNMKLASFDSAMNDFIRQNPGADAQELRVAGKHIMDLMDERFGEIADFNLFWSRTTKQVLGTLLRAPTWDLGLVRQSFGTVGDLGKIGKQLVKTGTFDKKLLDRPTFIMSLALLTAGINSLMTYLKTGQTPDGHDLVAYRTGGQTQYGNPERALLPGHQRELLEMEPQPGGGPLSGLYNLAGNKVSSLVGNTAEALNNTDFRGDPIGNYMERGLHVLGTPFIPMSLQQMYDGKTQGSNLTEAERFMNVRPAPAAISDPEQMARFAASRNQKAQATKRKHDAKDEARHPDRGF